ncbi:MAG: hypothetical protein AAFO94_01685 [Bacteroidota bacterium]
MSKIKLSIVSLLLLFSIQQANAGGGWPQPKGQGYFKLFHWWVVGTHHYTDSGLRDPNVTNGIFNTGLYGEYGFTDRLTGIAYFPFFSRALFNNVRSVTTDEIILPGEAINSIGDTDIGLKYGLIVNKPIVLSATVKFGLPLGVDDGGEGGRLQTGDGEFNQILRLDASGSFKIGSINAYGSVYAGVNNRTNGFSDEFRFGVEAGAGFFDSRLYAILRLVGIQSFNNGDREEIANSTSIFADGAEFLSFAPEIAYSFNDNWGVSASTGIALSGKLIFANPSYSVGVFYNLR